jgi:hypothetical protein
MRSQETTVAILPAPRGEKERPEPLFAQVVTLAALAPDDRPQIRVGADDTLVTARLAVPATRERLQRSVTQQQPVVVVFENGDRSRPLIVGFLEQADARGARPPAPGGATNESHTAAGDAVAADQQTMEAETSGAPIVEADVDGRRVRVTATDEIVLQCGQASVTLRRNGRVIIRGTYVETHADGTNRIKGGQVQIN